jgi:HEAT repeat protein
VGKSLYYITGGLFIVLIVAYAADLFSGAPRKAPPAELSNRALTGATAEERERAALELAENDAGISQMREVLAKSDSPRVKSAVIQGLGAQRDWESMPKLIDALSDPSEEVRDRAGSAVTVMLGVDYHFRAADPPQKRDAALKSIRKRYEAMAKSPPPFAKGTKS